MTNPTRPLSEVQEGANPCAPTSAITRRNEAALERLLAQQHARAEKARQEKCERARALASARNRKYRAARRAAGAR